MKREIGTGIFFFTNSAVHDTVGLKFKDSKVNLLLCKLYVMDFLSPKKKICLLKKLLHAIFLTPKLGYPVMWVDNK